MIPQRLHLGTDWKTDLKIHREIQRGPLTKEEQMGRFVFPETDLLLIECVYEGLPSSSDDEESACNAEYPG